LATRSKAAALIALAGALMVHTSLVSARSGTPATLISPAPGSTLTSSTVTFAWTAGSGVTQYFLYLGSSVGANDLFSSTESTNLSQTVSGLPTDGRTIYVRLWSFIGVWQFNDYTVTAAGPQKAQLTTPAPGSTLTASSVTFHWTAGIGVSQYFLYLGTAVGANNIFSGGAGTSLVQSVSGLPTDGSTIYVRLWSFTGVWQFNDYVLIAESSGSVKTQLVWRNPQTGDDGLWMMNGFAIQAAQAIPGAATTWRISAIADFDDDGHADLFWHNPQTGENGLWLMNGFTIQAAQAFPGASVAFQVAGVGDFDGDGKADILWRNPTTGENGIWLMNGATIQASSPIPSAGAAWVVAGVADFDGDGRADILWRNPLSGENGMWLMNGFTIQSAQAVTTAGVGWIVATAADFNGDGRADIFWRNPQSGENGLWLMNGFAIVASQALAAAGPSWQIVH
jgi:hypothetical protein